MRPLLLSALLCLFVPNLAGASGYGVFTQGAAALGQANAAVAHPVGASSLYFNPALMTEVPGRQVEVGTTAIRIDRKLTSAATGRKTSADTQQAFPSTFYYTEHHDALTAGIGLFFPFGLSTEWPSGYEGRYIGTRGEIFTLDINPAVAFNPTERLSLGFGLNLLYLDAELENAINQVAVGFAVPPQLGGPIIDPTLPDVRQTFSGDGWGAGYNFGLAYKITDRVSFGAAYRSHIDVQVDGRASFSNVDPRLSLLLSPTAGQTTIRLPQQATAGLSGQVTDRLRVEAGARWEDWNSTDQLLITLDRPVLGQSSQTIPRHWEATWAYNLGGEYLINPAWSILAGYLHGKGAVPAATFEPLIPDSDVDLWTAGATWKHGTWTVSGAVGYEKHDSIDKANSITDQLTGDPALSANGTYDSKVWLVAVSLGYAF